MTLLHAVIGGFVVAAGLSLAAIWLYGLHLRLAKDYAAFKRSVDEKLDDHDAIIAAMREDASALDDALADLHSEVEAIKRNPLGPPVDAEDDEDGDDNGA